MEFIKTPWKKQRKVTKKSAELDDEEISEFLTADTILKEALQHHRYEIRQLRATIKKHKLMMKQAKIAYELSK